MRRLKRPTAHTTEGRVVNETEPVEEILTEALRDGHTILHLNYKGLEALPPALMDKAFERVQKLFLKRNKLTTLPSSIGLLKSLKVLYLPSNEISSLPGEICELEQLECLDASNNCLRSLPSDIGKLPLLEKLYLSSNILTELPPEIGELHRLKVLIVTNNQLEFLPEEICNCSQLNTLHVDKNRLLKIPCEVIKLTSLKELSLMGNLLTHIPVLLGADSSLTCVNITNNPYLLTVMGNSHQFGAIHSVCSNVLGCGFRDPLELGLKQKQLMRINNCHVILPLEMKTVWAATDAILQPYPLLEAAFRACFKYKDVINFHQLPNRLRRQLLCPLAMCGRSECDVPIYTAAFAIAEQLRGPVNKVTLFHSRDCVPLIILRLLGR